MFKKLWNSSFVALFSKGVVLGKEMEFAVEGGMWRTLV